MTKTSRFETAIPLSKTVFFAILFRLHLRITPRKTRFLWIFVTSASPDFALLSFAGHVAFSLNNGHSKLLYHRAH